MAGEFPLPVRVVAGVLATGVERLRRLPQDLPALSVTVAGQAVRASMRVQQEVVQLAGRGDELLAGLMSTPSEHPEWAHFDEDDLPEGSTADGSPGGAEAEGPENSTADRSPGGAGAAGPDGPAAGAHDDPGAAGGAPDPEPGPADMPGYDSLRLPQVRARLRRLDAPAVARLLEHERAGAARPSFLTVLGNRLTSLQADLGPDRPA